MGQFDALVDELDRFQRWKGRKARKPSIAPRPSPGRTTPAQSFSKAMDTIAAELVDLRRQTARRTAQMRAQNAEDERQRRFAALDCIMSKAMAAVAEGGMTAVQAITIDRRCAAIAARLHAEDRAAKAGKAVR